MERAALVGTRIRDRRITAGMRQADLARAAGISPSYLNLIEHNRRRIGGKTLNQIADVLQVPATTLSEGAEATLLTALREAAPELKTDVAPELDRVEEFAGRFPGWADLIVKLNEDRAALTRTVNALSDRIAHDPELAVSLHEVISTVTSIRSTATILADGQALEAQWQQRFHRNINEDSERLAEEAESLVRYLERKPGSEMAVRSPLEQVHTFMDANDYHFSELEGAGGSARVASVVSRSKFLTSDTAQKIAKLLLDQYVQDARAMPLSDLEPLIAQLGPDPQALADSLGQPLARMARRLAFLPEDLTGPVGLYIMDSTGRMIVQKPRLGIDVSRRDAACVHWPLYQVFGQPGQIIAQRIRQGEPRAHVIAMSETVQPARIGVQRLVHAQMLILPDPGTGLGGEVDVGTACPLCTLGLCDTQ